MVSTLELGRTGTLSAGFIVFLLLMSVVSHQKAGLKLLINASWLKQKTQLPYVRSLKPV